MAARIWSIPDLPEGQPLAGRLEALTGGLYLEAGSVITPALKAALDARGIPGFVEATTGATTEHPQLYFQEPAPPPAVQPQPMPTIQLDAPHLERLLRAALPEQVPHPDHELAAQQFVTHLYRRPYSPLDLNDLQQLASGLLTWAEQLPGPPVLLPSTGRPDAWLAEHVLQSARWTAWIGVSLGLPRSLLESVITGALLRDVGQLAVDPNILYTGRVLDEAGRKQIADHPLYSAAWLSSVHIDDDEVLRTIRQHHERFDGQGYPMRLPGPRLSEGAQMLTLADTFSAVANSRPWRAARTLPAAIQALVQGAGAQFNPDLVRIFVQRVGPYPPGTIVELEHQHRAIVTGFRTVKRWRPEVRVIARLNGTVELGPAIDLSQQPVVITNVLR